MPDALSMVISSSLCKEQTPAEDADAGSVLLRDLDVLKRLQRNIGPDEPETLLAAENLVHLLKTYNVLYDAMTDMLMPYDLTVPKYNLLVILYNTPEHHLCMSEIGERMSFTRTNITKLVDGLEQQGLVRRANRPGDRRIVLAELTPDGDALMRCVMPRHFTAIRHLWNGMTEDESRLFTHLLLKLRHNIASRAQEVADNHELETIH